jgi:hypothetical protein
MKKSLSSVLVGAALVASAAVVQSIAWAQEATEAPKPKHTIHDVMEQAHGGGLLNKVAGGEATAEEKAQLLDLYISLAENEPERGEAASYHKFAGQALLAVAKVAAGREGAEGQLKASVDCMGCHRAHRPPQER